jgi:hypothetical protein
VNSLPGGRQKLLDLGIGQKVLHATIYSQCFVSLLELGLVRRESRLYVCFGLYQK